MAKNTITKLDESQYVEEVQTLDKMRKMAEKQNAEVVESTDTTLLLDIDSLPAKAQYNDVRGILSSKLPRLFGPQSGDISWPSKSGNEHIVVHLKTPIGASERIAFQAILGSDGKREALNLARIKKQGLGNEAIVLFRPKART